MRALLSVLAILALVAFAAPAAAQQEPTTGQDKAADTLKTAGQQGMTRDTTGGQVSRPTGETTTTTTTTQDTTTTGGGAGAMPTTASPLPVIALAGVLLVALGVGLRYLLIHS